MNTKYSAQKYFALTFLFSYSLTTHTMFKNGMLKKAKAYFGRKRALRGLYNQIGENARDFQEEQQQEPENLWAQEQDLELQEENRDQENIVITAHNYNNMDAVHYIEAVYSKTAYIWGKRIVLEKTFCYAAQENLLISTRLKIDGIASPEKQNNNYNHGLGKAFDFEAIRQKVETAVTKYRSALNTPNLTL
jgi:hypothetical protein